MLRKISIYLGLINFSICLGLFLSYSYVWQKAVQETELNCKVSGICFSSGGPNAYEYFVERYFLTGVLLIVFLTSKFIKYELVAQIIGIFSLCLIALQCRIAIIWLFKLQATDLNHTNSYLTLLHSTTPLIWLSNFIVLGLVIIQMIAFTKFMFQKIKPSLI